MSYFYITQLNGSSIGVPSPNIQNRLPWRAHWCSMPGDCKSASNSDYNFSSWFSVQGRVNLTCKYCAVTLLKTMRTINWRICAEGLSIIIP